MRRSDTPAAGAADAGRVALDKARNALVALRPVIDAADSALPGLAGRVAAYHDALNAISAAAIAPAPAGGGAADHVLVPLVWESDDWRHHRAETEVVIVSISRWFGSGREWRVQFSSGPWPRHPEGFDTLQQAKVWAREQYERVMSKMLAAAPTPRAAPITEDDLQSAYERGGFDGAALSTTPVPGHGVDLAGVAADARREADSMFMAPSGGNAGDTTLHARNWRDKPHRVLYDACNLIGHLCDALDDAVRAALAPRAGVAGLDWHEIMVDRGDGGQDVDGWEAATGFGTFYEIGIGGGCFVLSLDTEKVGDANDLDAIKAMAQADFTRRVNASLSPGSGGGSAGVVSDAGPLAPIAQWCEETFGPITVERLVSRAAEEMDELRAEPHKADEVADVIINLSRYPGAWNAVQAKMEVNRGRRWRLMGDGTGYHVKADGSTSAPKADGLGVPFERLVAQLEHAVEDQVILGERGTRNEWIDATKRQETTRNRLLVHAGGQGAAHTAAALDVLAERRRQVQSEGWTPEHDDRLHSRGELASVAATYAALDRAGHRKAMAHWPIDWDGEWFKPTTNRQNLVKAGALILAEIERLDRISVEHRATKGGA